MNQLLLQESITCNHARIIELTWLRLRVGSAVDDGGAEIQHKQEACKYFIESAETLSLTVT